MQYMLFCQQCRIAYNVRGIRRTSPPYKANRRFAVGWYVASRKPHQGRIARLGFFEARSRRLSAAERIPSVIRC